MPEACKTSKIDMITNIDMTMTNNNCAWAIAAAHATIKARAANKAASKAAATWAACPNSITAWASGIAQKASWDANAAAAAAWAAHADIHGANKTTAAVLAAVASIKAGSCDA